MKKIGKIALIIFVVVVAGYTVFALFLAPKGFTSEEQVVESFFENIKRNDVCLTHIVYENTSYCEDVAALFSDKDSITITTIDTINGEVSVVLDVDDVEVPLMFTFTKTKVTGLRGLIYDYYYVIDYLI
ncbi:hypothetical protein CI105_08635 [Candidatus Izimaplasma bacterium ZiA1]|uniref:hypothetical protein n=1 Tax=Candidatus Izimoplasma sp. ZiA1 TaxID=2024899 RepID=UPI000BAA6083|nr:hypothetical protein CI105_08635 [Candidatus Izimaplasma bacterium ZiA1]